MAMASIPKRTRCENVPIRILHCISVIPIMCRSLYSLCIYLLVLLFMEQKPCYKYVNLAIIAVTMSTRLLCITSI